MASAGWLSPRGCSRLTSWLIGSAGPSIVRTTSTYLFTKMLPDRVLGQSDKPLVETANVHHARWVMFTETPVEEDKTTGRTNTWRHYGPRLRCLGPLFCPTSAFFCRGEVHVPIPRSDSPTRAVRYIRPELLGSQWKADNTRRKPISARGTNRCWTGAALNFVDLRKAEVQLRRTPGL
jgi:hypothetical protein